MDIKYSRTLQDIEEAILSEEPYNWKKHLIFQLPGMFSFLLKGVVIYVFFVSILTTIISVGYAVILDAEIRDVVPEVVDQAKKL